MLVSLNSLRIYELASFYTKNTENYLLVINNKNWHNLPQEKKNKIFEFYQNVLPEDEIGEIFANDYTFYEFKSPTTAIDNAHSWFPQLNMLSDEDYFIECYVITPAGAIPYTNKVPKKSFT